MKVDLDALEKIFKSETGAIVLKKRLKLVLSSRMLEMSIDELRQERLSIETFVNGMATLQKPMPREPSHKAVKLARIFMRIQTNARPLFEACACQCMKRHKVLMKLDNRVPLQDETPELGYNTVFNLVFDLEMGLQEALVTASQTGQAMDDDDSKVPDGTAQNPLIKIDKSNLESGQDCSNKSSKVTYICDHARNAHSLRSILQLQLTKNHLSLSEESAKARRELLHPVTLECCLRNGTQNAMAQMTLPQRNLLALDIAAGILQLRQTCWFGSPFDNKGIKLFSDNWKNVRVAILEPSIEQVMEENPLKWSDVTRGPEPRMALLELAILLLELWNYELLEARTGLARDESEDARRQAAINWQEETATKLLEEHMTAIDFCITIATGRSRSWDDIKFLKEYCENIIIPLHEICKPYIKQTRSEM